MLFQSLSAIYNNIPFFSDVPVSTQYYKDIDEPEFFGIILDSCTWASMEIHRFAQGLSTSR